MSQNQIHNSQCPTPPGDSNTLLPQGYVLGPNEGEHLIRNARGIFIKVDQPRAELAIGDLSFEGLSAVAKNRTRDTFWLYEANGNAIFLLMTQFDLRRKDCVEGMSQLTNESVDLVVTSPPYNLGIDYRQYADRQDRQSYLDWCEKWSKQIRRILRANGSFFLNVGSAPSNPMLPHQIVIELTSASGGFFLQNTIHWIKSIAVEDREGGQKSHGHFKPINSKRFLNDCHEWVFHFTKNGRVELDRLAIGVPYQDKSNIARWSHTRGSDVRCRGNTWFIPYETIQSREKERPHPATFPVQLAEWCIKLHGVSRVRTMLDPFLGIGNSAVAAERCGVKKFIGFEIDGAYLGEARRRIG